METSTAKTEHPGSPPSTECDSVCFSERCLPPRLATSFRPSRICGLITVCRRLLLFLQGQLNPWICNVYETAAPRGSQGVRSTARWVSCSSIGTNMFINGMRAFRDRGVIARDAVHTVVNTTQQYCAARIFSSSSSTVAGCLDTQLGRFFESWIILIHALPLREAIWTNRRKVLRLR